MSESNLRTVAEIEAHALGLGLVVRYPKPNELFVDIDSELDFSRFKVLFEIFDQKCPSTYVVAGSPSGRPGHYHVVVTMWRAVFDARERVALQALLGSDTKHELLSWFEVEEGADHPSVFFERPSPPQWQAKP